MNFWPDTYGHKPHCMWCCYDVLFCILAYIRLHSTWEWWFFWYIGHKPISYVLCIWFHSLGVDLGAHNWWDVCVECEIWGTWVFDVCVKREALEHMSIWCLCWARSSRAHEYLMFVLREKFWSTWVFDVFVEREDLEHMSYEKIRIGSVGHHPWRLPICCWA